MTRSVLGVCAGLVACNVAFLAQAYLLAATWPEFSVHARRYQNAKIFDFSWPMACLLLVFRILAEVVAGWLAFRIARRHGAVWVLAGIGLTDAIAAHIVLHWSRFPWWYNLGVILPMVPAVLLGARFSQEGAPVICDGSLLKRY